jgi:uncharacterized protein (TIGR02996 family)
MSTHAAFLEAITAAPEDDVSRLVYADWLDDHDDPRRAEFIRLQCRLATMDESDSELPDLLDREWELLTVYRKRWEPGRKTVLGKHLEESDFVRGFLGRVRLPAEILLEHGEKLFRDYPLQELHLKAVKGRLGDILARPWMAGVSSLTLSKEAVKLDELRALATSPHLGGLRRLRLRNVGLTSEGLDLLVNWPGFRRLTHLDIGNEYLHPPSNALDNRPGEGWIRRMIESPHLGELTSFTTWFYSEGTQEGVSSSDLAVLANSPRLAALTHLTFVSARIDDDGYRILGAAKGLRGLRHLSVGWNQQGIEGIPALVGSPLIARLETLDLSSTGFGAGAARALAASPHLGRLRKLDLTQCNLGPEEARALASARFGSLADLSLFNDRIGPKGMAALAASPHLASLRRLCLLGSQIGAKGARSLVGAVTLAGLRYLDLYGNGLGPDEAKILAGAPHWAGLRHLSVGGNQIGALGARTLLRSANLAGLWTLDLSESNMTDATARDAAAKTPLRELRRLIVHNYGPKKLTEEGERALAGSPLLPHLLQIDQHARFSDRPWYVTPTVLEQGKGHELVASSL